MTVAAIRIALYRQACERRPATTFHRENRRRVWGADELAILADGMARGLTDAAIAARLEGRTVRGVAVQRAKLREASK